MSPAFWYWPATLQGGVDCDALTGHVDLYRTLAAVAGAKLSEKSEKQATGRSLVPLLTNPQADWQDRTLITHVGRWARGEAANAKHAKAAIRNTRYSLVNDKELYDLQKDPGQKTNVIEQHAVVAAELRKAYDRWWEETLPLMVNEDAVGPAVNPFKAQYWKQFGGGPTAKETEKKSEKESDKPSKRNRKPKRSA